MTTVDDISQNSACPNGCRFYDECHPCHLCADCEREMRRQHRPLHTCQTCGRVDAWGPEWRWRPSDSVETCSDACRANAPALGWTH